MKIRNQKKMALLLIRMRMRKFAKQRRESHERTYLSANFEYAYAGASISFADCCELITRAQAIKYHARLAKLHTAPITRNTLKAAA